MSARDRFFLEDLRSPFHYDEHELDLPKISRGVQPGGEVNGGVSHATAIAAVSFQGQP